MAPTDDKVRSHEQSAQEYHHWVRLTTVCNNRCRFCLDAKAAERRTHAPYDELERQVREGRKKGANRLILSGGEASIHPQFINLIRLGRRAGYERVQTITNGRRFAYDKFLQACLDAGLGEITFSIHGHDAKLHDELVGVPGAFDQAVAGLQAALADGRPIVNVDVCLNRRNIPHLPALLDRFAMLGVREFDLLHLIPFGRAFEQRECLEYDIGDAMGSIEYALDLARRPDFHIWFNRFPPAYLEGHEHLIQDPAKLLDEVRGRREELECLVRTGEPLSCSNPERCRLCYLQLLCEKLDDTLAVVGTGPGNLVRFRDLTERERVRKWFSKGRRLWVEAESPVEAASLLEGLSSAGLVLGLRTYEGLSERLDQGWFVGHRLTRAYAASADEVGRLLASGEQYDVVAYLTRNVADYLQREFPDGDPRLVLTPRHHALLTESAEQDVDLRAWLGAYRGTCRVEGVPFCLSARAPSLSPTVFDAAALDDDGRVDPFGFTQRFILDDFLLKSRRCRQCALDGECRGIHINQARAHGLVQLRPVACSTPEEPGAQPALDGAS